MPGPHQRRYLAIHFGYLALVGDGPLPLGDAKANGLPASRVVLDEVRHRHTAPVYG